MKYITTSILLFATSANASSKNIVNDVTKMNPIVVTKILEPRTVEDIKNGIHSSTGPVSIGGGRFSMGGQTATENALQIDMRSFNKILSLDLKKKLIVVQAGVRWRDIQEYIDPHDLSIMIMQTYSNFTVGGSLSVNAHGRYVGGGPVINSVESIVLILADGREITASRLENQDLFFSAIGGYGGIGVISQVTLRLASNEKIRREVSVMSAKDYRNYFAKKNS